MSVINAVPLLAAAGGDYQISRSVRLRSSASGYFSRTPSSTTSRTIWTWSAWVKRGSLPSSRQGLFTAQTSGSVYWGLEFDANNCLNVYDSNAAGALTTSSVYRDPSSWYHIVVALDTTQATAANRTKLYVNGSQVTTFGTTNYPTQNSTSQVNTASVLHAIGNWNPSVSNLPFDGYLTEINFIDGQALTPSSFGENDTITGVWKPKKYAGTYGTNGFYLNFSDNSAATAATIGKDYSGNGNNWTPNNISVTSGVTYDSMIDTPTPYIDGGTNRGNYCTLSPLQIGPYAALSAGNLRVTGNSGTNSAVSLGTFSPTSGKWYWEVTQGTVNSEFIGVMTKTVTGESLIDGSALAQTLGKGVVARYNGLVRGISGELQLTTTSTWTSGDIIQLAVDLDNGAVYFGKNGTWLNSGVPTSGSSKTGSFLNFTQDGTRCCTPACDAFNSGYVDANFGQRPFTYTPPSGFKALNTQNLPDSTIKRGGSYFNSVLYTGNAGNQSITGVGFQPDLVWGKLRSTSGNHRLHDSLRGSDNTLSSNLTDAEVSGNGLVSFDADGFTMDSGTNINQAYTYVAWNWKESATAGFDIVTFTNPSSGSSSFAHNLGVKPSMIITKARSGTGNWTVTHKSLGANMQDYYLLLNGTAASTTSAGIWGGEPTSSVFYSSASLQVPSATMVAYLFSEVAGFSKFGSYTGNGSADGPFVFCGFRPRFVMIKRTDTTGNWVIHDTSRPNYNATSAELYPNLSNSEGTSNGPDKLANGFKLRDTYTDVNASGGTYIYAAFAENPFKNALAR